MSEKQYMEGTLTIRRGTDPLTALKKAIALFQAMIYTSSRNFRTDKIKIRIDVERRK